MEAIAGLLAERQIAVARFEFGYMAARRDGAKRRPPPKAETLMPQYENALQILRARWRKGPILIGGKSMGGRVASLIAGAAHERGDIAGIVCLGYPFHPPAKPEQLRTAHLMTLACPALIVQGERDPFGSRKEVAELGLPATFQIHWAGDGDHDLGPRGGSGFTRKGNLTAAADAIVQWCQTLREGLTPRSSSTSPEQRVEAVAAGTDQEE